jgi:23S rRNA pseudouridine2605 synthase
MTEMRLQKYLAESGVASRRKAEQLIQQGRVRVNGQVVAEMGFKVTGEEIIEVDDKRAKLEEKKVYVLLNKPAGYVTTAKDQFGRRTVLDLLADIRERIYPVGRLDYDTSGLILLTNDGDFTYRLTHPRHEVNKIYTAEVEGIPTPEELNRFSKGLQIEDYTTAPAKIRILMQQNGNAELEVRIHEGKNRQVRKMCDAIGHPVIKLKRVAIGKVHLGELSEGQWRHLTENEIRALHEESS